MEINATPIMMDQAPINIGADTNAVQPILPQSRLDYLRTSPLTSGVQRARAVIEQRKRERDIKRKFEIIMAMGEQGGRAAYADAIATYGEEVKSYLPTPDIYRDKQSGRFMPVDYSKALFVGVQKFKEQKLKEQQAEFERKGLQAIAPTISGATDPRQVAGAAAEQGVNPDKLDKVYSLFPKPINPLEQRKTEAEIDLKEAQAEKARRLPVPKRDEKDEALETVQKELTKAESDVLRFESSIKDIQNKKAEALKNKVFDTSVYDEQLADAKANLEVAKGKQKVARQAVSEVIKTQSTEARRAMYQANLEQSEQGLNKLHEIYGTPQADIDTARMSPISSSMSSEGDPDVLAALQSNQQHWAKYQSADPETKKAMRARVRAYLDGNTTTR